MPDHPATEGKSVVSADTVITLVERFTVSALKSSGNERIAQWIEQWPEILGGKAGVAIKRLLEKRAKGQVITQNDTKEVTQELADDPRAAATLLGLLTVDLLEGAMDAQSRRKAILQTYGAVLEVICTYMAGHTTSVVLKGFIHREDCISYWHFERSNLEFSWSGSDHLFPNGLKVYFRDEEPDDERVFNLNLEIADDPDHHLPQEFYDFEHDPKVAQLDEIYDTKITFHQLDPAAGPRKKDPLGLTLSDTLEYSQKIPGDLAGLKGLIDSLVHAHEALEQRLNLAKQATQDIKNKHQKAS
jgi:hypothetical protein